MNAPLMQVKAHLGSFVLVQIVDFPQTSESLHAPKYRTCVRRLWTDVCPDVEAVKVWLFLSTGTIMS